MCWGNQIFLVFIWILSFGNKHLVALSEHTFGFSFDHLVDFKDGDCDSWHSQGSEATPFQSEVGWEQAYDRSYVHGVKQDKQQQYHQFEYANSWSSTQAPAYYGGGTPRGKGHGGKTPRGKGQGGKSPRGQGQAKGEFQFPMPPQFPYPQPQMAPPLPPPTSPPPWMNQAMPMPPQSAMPMPMMPQQQQMPQMMPCPATAPMMPMAMPVPTLPQNAQDAAQKELIAYFRNRQSDLPSDMQKKMKDFTRKQGARITKDLQTAALQLGEARTELEEALQARAQHIGTWKMFLTEAVKNWWSYANHFDQHERALLSRIAQAKEQFQEAKECLEESKIAAGTLTEKERIQEISDDDGLPGESDQPANQIKEGIRTLTTSLQQLQKDADSIEVEQFASNKRPRVETSTPVQGDAAMPGDQDASGQHFGAAGHA
eukprot:s2437_g1.t1